MAERRPPPSRPFSARGDGEDGARPEGTAGRAFWSGSLSFGLVSIPVDLMSASRRGGVATRMLSPDGEPLRRRYVCPREGKVLGDDEIVRGYEFERGRFVPISSAELQALEPEKSREIRLERFVPREQVDPLYYERPYVFAPSGEGAAKAYHLLARTMERADRAGVATFVMRGREHLVALLAERGALTGEVLRFADEMRVPESIGLPARRAVDPRRVEAFSRAIDALAGPLDREELADREARALRALAEQKYADGRDVVTAPADEEDIGEDGGELVDLVALLKERLGGGGERAPPRASGEDGAGQSREELYQRARSLGIRGRSRMSKAELAEAIRAAG